MVARRAAAALGGAALSLTLAVPAQAEAAEPVALKGSVTASGTTLRATCHYARLFQIYDYSDTAQISGAAVAGPEAFVRLQCTVTPRYGSVTVSASGPNHAAASKSAQLYGGPTTICVEATATHVIPMLDETVRACRTYQD